ncbi:MAG: hypothetical protein NT128_01115 [Proteobacteria bacterium]|nr:hypothetical protein [Pseudomonadota bacterium]
MLFFNEVTQFQAFYVNSFLSHSQFMNLLDVKNLSVRFSPAGRPVVDAVQGISFAIKPKQILALVGEGSLKVF